jgi:hypothetical protein
MTSLLPSTQSLQFIYTNFIANKSKDKLDMILEPLQSMIQLALLGIYPSGTKLQIQENILSLQVPNIIQPISRWYNSDKKDDLYFLYSVIKRYIKWYNPTVNKKSPLTPELYQLLTAMSVQGLNSLFKTYSLCNSNTVIHVIQMYKNILESNNDKIMMDEFIVDGDKNKINIDEVFEKIIHIYDKTLLNVIYNTLQLIKNEQDDIYQRHMVDGLNLILHKHNKLIKEWIKMNLVL